MSDYIVVGGRLYHANDFLAHYGVKGMKWGVLRYRDKNGKVTEEGKRRAKEYEKDRAEQNKAARNVAVTRKRLVGAYAEHDTAAKEYDSAVKKHTKAKSRLFKSDEEIELTAQEVEEWSREYKVSKTALHKAARAYNEDRKKLVNKTKQMTEKYGAENVQQIEKIRYQLGKNRTLKLVDTDITLADLPIIGSSYAEKHIAEIAQREQKREMDYRSKVDATPEFERERRNQRQAVR